MKNRIFKYLTDLLLLCIFILGIITFIVASQSWTLITEIDLKNSFYALLLIYIISVTMILIIRVSYKEAFVPDFFFLTIFYSLVTFSCLRIWVIIWGQDSSEFILYLKLALSRLDLFLQIQIPALLFFVSLLHYNELSLNKLITPILLTVLLFLILIIRTPLSSSLVPQLRYPVDSSIRISWLPNILFMLVVLNYLGLIFTQKKAIFILRIFSTIMFFIAFRYLFNLELLSKLIIGQVISIAVLLILGGILELIGIKKIKI